MANTFGSGTLAEKWMMEVQDSLDKRLVAKGISEVYTGSERIIHNPYNSVPTGSDGAATLSYTVADFTSTDDTITVNRRATVAEHIDSIEELQTNYSLMSQRAERASYRVRDIIDQYTLNKPVSFSGVNDIDAGDFAGSAGSAYQISATNGDEVANKIIEELMLNDGAIDRGTFWVVDPKVYAKLTNFQQNSGNNLGDAAIKNGFVDDMFGGLGIYVSNNLTNQVNLGLATNPTDGDTLTLTVSGNGGARRSIVITFVATLAGNPGEIHITSSADITRANLVAFLNGYGATSVVEATDTGATALSVADQEALKRAQIETTNNNSTNVMAVTTKGSLSVAETLTDGTDAWGVVGVHTIAGVKGSIFLALPSDGMTFKSFPASGKHGEEVVTAQVYNATIWENSKGEIHDVFVYA